ncbi:4-alpha-glucanotransferase [Thiovibrio frasassiensis]|uniref:4-alpha-glucanotransferase n=1 Tax=Thiovibrio frasassiensis TaxID=2984131 RepID=A0A9X4MGU1_9BACT|nr:4-alpha-glucanotransferase [Thiovibrio frasassiensis]MDG4476986.1 4-alpha-glucanotransferase [Thiovibrio frasassiensis]
MHTQRSSGLLLHLTSLPGPFGIGTLGKGGFEFIDYLKAAGQSHWQILPYGPVTEISGNSPYMSLSAFAGNPLLIDAAQLVGAGFLRPEQVEIPATFSEYLVDFSAVRDFNEKILARAFLAFRAAGASSPFAAFCQAMEWLDDYALFMALREEFHLQPWFAWPEDIGRRKPEALALWRETLAERILFHKFVQFCFFSQWQILWDYAHCHGIRLIGDIPIYVALDSADVWANQECFLLDRETGQPTHVAGVPPDYFSDTGQRWGNPLFKWYSDRGVLNASLLAWWGQRFRHICQTVDVVRIDHFRGFEAYWQIPASEETAVNGEWIKGPGLPFFNEMKKHLGALPIIAEDLGVITPEVELLRDNLGFPGMKVLQFAFDSDEHNAYLPHNYTTVNCVVYTGTHDNDTTLGWYFSDTVMQSSKARALRYAHSQPGSAIHWDFIRLAYGSVADLVIVPLQDVLGFGSDCRMNIPGTSEGNWRWRCAARFMNDTAARALRDEVVFYNRRPAAPVVSCNKGK